MMVRKGVFLETHSGCKSPPIREGGAIQRKDEGHSRQRKLCVQTF